MDIFITRETAEYLRRVTGYVDPILWNEGDSLMPKTLARKKKPAPAPSEITADWLRSLGYNAMRDCKGEYPTDSAELFLQEDPNRIGGKKFVTLSFTRRPENACWSVILGIHTQGQSRDEYANMQLANVTTQADVIALLAALKKPEPA